MKNRQDKRKKINKKWKYILLIAFILCILIFIISLKQNTTINKLNKKLNSSNAGETIDLTELATGKEASHTCSNYYVSKYDLTNHWKQCSVCGKIEGTKKAHSYTDYWTMGEDSCSNSNYHVFICECGYSYKNQDNKNPHSIQLVQYNQTLHAERCVNCKGKVANKEYHYMLDDNGNKVELWCGSGKKRKM